MNAQEHAVTMTGITMMTMMKTLNPKVTPPVITTHKVKWKRKGTVF